MEFVNTLETTVAGWVKNVPHLPVAGQKWLKENVWWIVLVGAILTGISLLVSLGALFTLVALLGSPVSYYYVAGASPVSDLSLVSAIIGLVFIAIRGALLALSVKPLKDGQKKGWNLLFLTWLVNILAILVGAVFTFSVFGFFFAVLFGAIGIAITGYFLFEIRGQYNTGRVVKEAKVVTPKA